MRSTGRFLFVIAAVGAAVAVMAVPSGAGAPGANTVTIVKEVVGTAPVGTTFTVQVDCQSNLLTSTAALIPTVTFDATGTATSPDTVNVPAGQVCTITETANGGATTVGYACDIVRGETDQIGPPFLGNCTGDNVVTFTDVIGDAATVTVTNTFVAPTPPAPPVAQALQVAPTFTG
jgi:hypothetical protein